MGGCSAGRIRRLVTWTTVCLGACVPVRRLCTRDDFTATLLLLLPPALVPVPALQAHAV
jgi:hypothetical protein